jgi:hypothetical protein
VDEVNDPKEGGKAYWEVDPENAKEQGQTSHLCIEDGGVKTYILQFDFPAMAAPIMLPETEATEPPIEIKP